VNANVCELTEAWNNEGLKERAMGVLHWLLSKSFLPHEYCYRLNSSLIGLHLWSDLLIGISYVAISLTLVYLVRRGRRDIPFHWMFLAFGAFIIACGGTHFMEVWTLTTPVYWLSGLVKSVTAAASVFTAFALPPLVPKTLTLVRAAKLSDARQMELEIANAALQNEIAERRRAEEQVRSMAAELEERVTQRTAELAKANVALAENAAIVQHSRDAILSWSLDGTVNTWNPAAERIFGYSGAEMIGAKVTVLLPTSRPQEFGQILEMLRAGEVQPFETTRRRKDGHLIDVHLTISALHDADGRVRGASVIARDITETKRAEEQLRQVQKLESLGLIAGGVAHDFNNLLVGIMGNASMALEFLQPDDPNKSLMEQIVQASESAAHLTQQLLAYAGKGRFVSQRIDLSELVRKIGGLLQSSIPRNVTLRLDLTADLPPVEADPTQLQQVVMNLLINGAEAIGDASGVVRVSTSYRSIGEMEVRQQFAAEEIAPGEYLALEVADNGCGMDDATRARIFDPFFTTKFTGRGLGLSAVMGIVRSHRGALQVTTAPGKGSTFLVVLPACDGNTHVAAPLAIPEELRGSGTILVVDDEEVVRSTARNSLARFGYTVLTARDGQEGVDLFARQRSEIALVLLDMTMPVMSGTEAFRRIRQIQPDACVVVSSGFDEQEATRRFTAEGIAAFIQKPYTARALAKTVKMAMQRR
jgi:two-component system cell cycle sensor histidine kinase/response regulator CckA